MEFKRLNYSTLCKGEMIWENQEKYPNTLPRINQATNKVSEDFPLFFIKLVIYLL